MSMLSNEELAVLIQDGHKEYNKLLYSRVKLLMYKLLSMRYSGIPLPAYIDKEDLQQNLYFAFLKAVESFKRDKPYKFNSYIEYHIRNTTNRYINKVKKVKELSYNAPMGDEEDTELIETMELEGAENYITDLDFTDNCRTIRECVDKLPEKERNYIHYYYFGGYSLRQIAELYGVSSERIRQIIQRGLKKLRGDPVIKELWEDYAPHIAHTEDIQDRYINMWFSSNEYRNTLEEVKEKYSKGGYISYGEMSTALELAKRKYLQQHCAEHIQILKAVNNGFV